MRRSAMRQKLPESLYCSTAPVFNSKFAGETNPLSFLQRGD
jgi:hypothetical protein